MARVTVEDCLEREENRFALVVLAAARTRQIMKGSRAQVRAKNRPSVLSLREIAAGKVHFNRPSTEVVEEWIAAAVKRDPLKIAPRIARSAYPDKELEAGSLAHYDDAAYYTKTYQKRKDDVAFYVDLAQRHGEMLEYGVGNGRLALPAARAGVLVTGVDHSRPMIDDFKRQLAAEPAPVQRRVTLRHGDMRKVRLGRRFKLVTCPFNAFLHLYERMDVERFLARVREHLAPRGVFVFDVSNPSAHELVRDPNRAYFCPRFRYPTGEMVRYTERFDYDLARQILFVTMEFLPQGRESESWITPLAHRQFFPRELEALLHYNGFVIDDLWGDYKRTKFDRYSDMMVFAARVARAGRVT